MAQDIILDENFDAVIFGGDWKVENSDQQHVEHLLLVDKGQLRQYPTAGVGIRRYINASIDPVALKQIIRVELENDGNRVNNIIVSRDFKISIDAERII